MLGFTELESVPVLLDLEGRAGASDTDREAWLAERRGGVTATELARVMVAANREVAIADLVRQKRVGDAFTGNAYTEWGKAREPVILAYLAGHGVVPESRVFHAAENSRFLASPDGLSIDFDEQLVLEEVKTSGVPLPKGSEALARKGYEWQMQWCCYVTGAVGCWLSVELRHGEPGRFTAGARSREWFPRDEGMIAQLVEVAELVLAAMDAAPVEDGFDEEVDTHAVNYLRAIAEEKAWAALKRASYEALIVKGVSQESPLARVTFTPGRPERTVVEEVPDVDAAALAFPKEAAALKRARARVERLEGEFAELTKGYVKSVEKVVKGSAARVTVTAGKEMKK